MVQNKRISGKEKLLLIPGNENPLIPITCAPKIKNSGQAPVLSLVSKSIDDQMKTSE